MGKNGKPGSIRAASKLDLTKPVKVGVSAEPRSKSAVFGAIAPPPGEEPGAPNYPASLGYRPAPAALGRGPITP